MTKKYKKRNETQGVERMSDREISEKELVFQLIQDEQLDSILKAFNENTKNKNAAFKRMKVKQLLNGIKTIRNRLTPFEFLIEQLAFEPMKGEPIEKMLRIFNYEEMEMPEIVKYCTLRQYHPAFFKEHYEEMKTNILNNEFFLTNIQVFQSEESLKSYYFETFDQEKSPEEVYLDVLIDWYEANVQSIDEHCEMVKDWDMREFDTKRRQLAEDNETGLMLAMLKEKRVDDEWHKVLIQHAIHDCLIVSNLKKEEQLEKLSSEFKLKIEELKELNKTDKKKLKETEQQMKELLKEKQLEINALNEDWSKKIAQLEENHQKEVSLLGDRAELMNEIDEKVLELESQLQLQKDLQTHYQWALRADYTHLGVIVFHKSQLMYAQNIFPEIQFVTNTDQIDKEKTMKVILIQKYGLSHQQRRQAQRFAQENQLNIQELGGREEREQIMMLSNYLSKQPNLMTE